PAASRGESGAPVEHPPLTWEGGRNSRNLTGGTSWRILVARADATRPSTELHTHGFKRRDERTGTSDVSRRLARLGRSQRSVRPFLHIELPQSRSFRCGDVL